MANRPSPASAARAAVAAAASVTRGIEQALLATVGQNPGHSSGGATSEPATDTGQATTTGQRTEHRPDHRKPDGRRRRWEKHKQVRRTELTDGTIDAVRALGAEVGMDEIAAHIGVSKTVLYRYFTDKNDLTNTTAIRFFETSLLPRLTEAITDDLDEYTLTRRVIEVYVLAVADDPNLYRFALSGAAPAVNADSEKLVAQLLTTAITMRVNERDGDTSGAEVWSYMLVGGMQRAVDFWMTDRRIPVEEMLDYLTMMVWSSIVGIGAVNGSRTAFIADPPTLPTTPGTDNP